MGQALLGGLLAAGTWSPDQVVVVEIDPDRRTELIERFPGVTVTDRPVAARGLIVATKPAGVADGRGCRGGRGCRTHRLHRRGRVDRVDRSCRTGRAAGRARHAEHAGAGRRGRSGDRRWPPRGRGRPGVGRIGAGSGRHRGAGPGVRARCGHGVVRIRPCVRLPGGRGDDRRRRRCRPAPRDRRCAGAPDPAGRRPSALGRVTGPSGAARRGHLAGWHHRSGAPGARAAGDQSSA